MKNNFFKTKQLVKSIIVANLFNFWLNERQLGFQICFCIQSVISHVMYLWKLHCILMRVGVKRSNYLLL